MSNPTLNDLLDKNLDCLKLWNGYEYTMHEETVRRLLRESAETIKSYDRLVRRLIEQRNERCEKFYDSEGNEVHSEVDKLNAELVARILEMRK